MNWFYAARGQQTGPVTEEQLGELVSTGTIRPDTLVWREGLAAWMAYREVQASSPVSGAPAVAASGYTPGHGPEAVCAECNQLFAIQDMMRHGASYVCAGCKPVFLQKLAAGARVETSGMNYAGFWIRLAAYFVDFLVLLVLNIGIGFAIGFIIGLSMAGTIKPHSEFSLGFRLALLGVQLAVSILYEVILVGSYGATFGKMACQIKVVTADGEPVSYLRALGRRFAKFLSGFACCVGYIITGFDSEKRALHDYICSTRVVYK
jgi:uncharacterized RDD family membrane protein YckC